MDAHRFGAWLRGLRRAPRSRSSAPVPDAAPALSPEHAQERLRELRRSSVRTWEPPDPVALASFLHEVADTLHALEPGLSALEALRDAAARVDDAEALFRAGWELVDIGLDELAVAPLARTLTLQPRDVATVNELALALEAAGSPAAAARLYRENAWATAESESARGLTLARCGDGRAIGRRPAPWPCRSTPQGSGRSSGIGPCVGSLAPTRCADRPG